ncbi:MAG: lipid-A-disaccharide synthase, partial [Gammaproteobacteria bacterium]|nr:lipid-A-disaccharide synthase [Gammaproteobacteria bacterium]
MSTPLKIGLVAGETSGDNLAAPLIKAIRQMHPDANIFGIGGERMVAEGMDSWVEMERLSVNGIVDPLLRLPELLRILRQTADRLIAAGTDVFVGVDFNFFNLLLEGRLKKAGIPTVHYVSPSVWAWRRGRIRKIARSVDLMMTLYPFETPVYEAHGIRACFVGHPKADEIDPRKGILGKEAARLELGMAATDRVLAVLPGSRGSEINLSLPDFMATC